VPSALPLGDPAPPDGLLPGQAVEGAAARAFGLYVHIPFCAVRCGYCDFNTYTATELGGGASQDAYAGTAIAEIDFAASALENSGLPARPLSTVFFGGGTPTL
jgi:oxygen-independent coproporphyrinogen-3 oxidase